MILPFLAVVIGLTLDGATINGPDATAPVNSLIAVELSAEGHPVELTVEAIRPDGLVEQMAACPDATSCVGGIALLQCGVYRIIGVANYAHEDPAGGGLYVTGAALPVAVVGCNIFADGFESGGAGAWSSVVP